MASPAPQPRTSFGEAAYHEFYRDDFEPRAHYRPLWEHIRRAGQSLLSERRREAHWTLRTDGVTFTVYGDEADGIERVWPLDLLPRIIPAAEWAPIHAGLEQRLRALNAFLADLYGAQRVLRDGVVPAELIYRGKDFRREIHGIVPPLGVFVHVAGIDLVRDERGRYLVLEDNLRTPSGVSYMIENRIVERRTLPEFFARYRVRRVEHYPALLLQVLREVSPRGKDDAVVVLLTPGAEQRAGVCQDFAHLLVAVVRSWGFAARYVMGYVDGDTVPEETQGREATHAWAEVLIPGAGWRGFDATAGLVANDGYVAVAVGRDSRDAAPLRGTFKGDEGSAAPQVALRVERAQQECAAQ